MSDTKVNSKQQENCCSTCQQSTCARWCALVRVVWRDFKPNVMSSRTDRGNTRSYEQQLSEYASKSVELSVIKEIVNTNCNILRERRTALNEEQKKLNDINYNVWTAENTFCDNVWNFALDHNFAELFNRNLGSNATIKFRKCQCIGGTVLNDAEQNLSVKDLKDEIEAINDDILQIGYQKIEQRVAESQFTLKNLIRYTEEISELIELANSKIKLDKPIKLSPRKMQHPSNENAVPQFVNAKWLLKNPNFRTGTTILGRKMIDRKTDEYEEPDQERKKMKVGKFVLKKQSNISLKFREIQRN